MTGGTGMLGRALVPALCDAGHDVRVLSRSERPSVDARANARRGDLRTGDGVAAALGGVEVVVHAATSPFRRTRATDVDATAALLDAAAATGVAHVVYPSIVGVDRHPFRYYRAKWAAEQVVGSGPVPWTIARATQFHELFERPFQALARLPVMPVPAFVFQPVDAAEYAAVLVGVVAAGPSGRVPDTGGPEVRRFASLARAWLQGRGKRRAVVTVPAPGRAGRAFRAGVHTCPDRATGTVSYERSLEATG